MKTDVDYIFGETLPEPGTAMEVAPGIRWIRMPLPFALDHVNLFLLDDGEDGWVLVDTGAALKPTQDLWELVLANELQGKPITQIIVTHFHPDHVGNAGWLQEACRRAVVDEPHRMAVRPGQPRRAAGAVPAIRAGFLQPRRALRPAGRRAARPRQPLPQPGLAGAADLPADQRGDGAGDRRPDLGSDPVRRPLSGAYLPVLPGRQHGAGGDFLLPRISPNVSVWWNEPEGNPLADYIRFLQNLDYMEDDILVLPSHDRPYRGLHERRADLIAHHEERFDLALEVCAEPSTAADVMYTMFKRQLDAHQSRFAIGEALAHLNYLVEDGQLERSLDENGVWRYRAEA